MMDEPTWSTILHVERGKIREFGSVFKVPPRGDETLWAPPTFPVVWNHWSVNGSEIINQLGLQPGRILHGEEEQYYPHRPLVEGQRLRATVRVVSREQKQGRRGGRMQFIRLRTDLTEAQTGEVVAEVTRTLIERE